jgi:hypothetical protein
MIDRRHTSPPAAADEAVRLAWLGALASLAR